MKLQLFTLIVFTYCFQAIAIGPNTNQQKCDAEANMYFTKIFFDCRSDGQYRNKKEALLCIETTETILKLYPNLECEAETSFYSALFHAHGVESLNGLAKDYLNRN